MMNKYYFSEDNRESLPDIMDRLFTENQLREVYRDIIDKTGYKDFQEWFFDMLKMGLIICVRIETKISKKRLRQFYNIRKVDVSGMTGLESQTYKNIAATYLAVGSLNEEIAKISCKELLSFYSDNYFEFTKENYERILKSIENGFEK